MRVDKFLKVSRLIKRRPLAKQVAEQGRVQVNGKKAKPGVEVNIGDVISIRYGQKTVEVEILRIANAVKKDQAETMYRLIAETEN